MSDGLEARLRWLFGGVAVVLVATGAFALLVTSTTEPAQVSTDPRLYAFVRALLAAAIVSFAAVGARVAWAPRRNTHLMPVFVLAGIAAFACETVAALRAWQAAGSWTEPASVAFASLALALACALGWRALWLAERPGDATARRDAVLFEALLATLVPAGEGLELDASDDAVRTRIVAAFAARSTRRWPVLRLALRTLDALAVVGYRRRFDTADQATRERIVAELATSRRPRLRALQAALREIILGAFWDDARVRAAVGDDPVRVRTLLESGPNAVAHRARREAAEQAALAADLADAAAALAVEAAAQAATADVAPAPGAEVAPALSAAAASAPGVEVAPAPVAEAAPGPPAGDAPGEQAQPAQNAAEPATDHVPDAAEPQTTAARPDRGRRVEPGRASDGPKPIVPQAEELPFDRPWTLGVPAQEAAPRQAIGPVLRVARPGGPTRR